MIVPLLLVALCFAATGAQAKCPYVGYTVSGVVAGEDGKPVKGASITITSLGEFLPSHPTIVSSNEAGEFKAQMRFDTYSGGSVSGDDCFRKPGKVTLSVQAAGFNPATKQVPIGSDLKAVADLALAKSPQ